MLKQLLPKTLNVAVAVLLMWLLLVLWRPYDCWFICNGSTIHTHQEIQFPVYGIFVFHYAQRLQDVSESEEVRHLVAVLNP